MAGFLRLVVVALSLILLSAAAAWAQNGMFPADPQPQAPRGQDRAVFGGGVGSADQVLSANSNVGATYFETLNGNPTGPTGETLPSSTWFGQGSAFLAYRLGVKSFTANAALGEFSYYFPDQKRWFKQTIANGGATYSHGWQLTPRTLFSVSESAQAQPAYYSALPMGYEPSVTTADPALTLPPDLTGFGGLFLDSQSGAGITHNLTRRVSLAARYDFMRRWSFDRPDNLDLEQHSGLADLNFGVTRHLSVRAGYHAYDTRFGPAGTRHVRTQNLDFGIDYNRGGSLQLTRRTTLSFNLGAAAVTDSSGTQRYMLLGGAGLDHEMGRSWTSGVRYNRDVQFSSIFQEPVLTDTVSGQVSGQLAPRLVFQAGGGYSHGSVGFTGVDRGLDLGYALVGLQTGLTRYLALGTNYTIYHRTLGSQVVLPVGLPAQTDTQAVRVYLSTWVPLFTRTRRPNATR